MAKASRVGATPPCRYLAEEIAVWEILVRLPPKSLLRCRAVCRAWRQRISTRDFLLAHHGRQPCLPVAWCAYVSGEAHYEDILALDHPAADAQLRPVARLDDWYCPEVSCDGLLILSNKNKHFSICNPATREHSPIGTPWDFSKFSLMGMYLHRPTSEYRLLLHHRWSHRARRSDWHKGNIGCYVFPLGSDQPPRYIGGPSAASELRFRTPALLHDSLHWFPIPPQHQSGSRLVLSFDTTTELFRQMRAPVVRPKSNIFEADGTLGIYSYNDDSEVVLIWMLENYEGEVWNYKYRVKFPFLEIRDQFGRTGGSWFVSVVSADGGILLLLSHGGWMFYVNTAGELVHSFHRDGQYIYASDLRLKQTLVPHKFLTALEGYAVNASPFL